MTEIREACWLTVSACLIALLVGCSPDSTPSSVDVVTVPSTTVDAAVQDPIEPTPSTPTPVESATATTAETEPAAEEILRLAPAGPEMEVLQWTKQEVERLDPSLERTMVAEGPFAEVADVPDVGIAFQRVEQEPVIWLSTASGSEELIVASTGQWLTLEGAGLNDNGEPIVYYQRHEVGSPITSRSSLRTYNLDTGEVREIIETGGWEAGTNFNHISDGALVVANWRSEAAVGTTIVDLSRSSQVIWDQTDEGCFDGQFGCLAYQNATIIEGRTIGVQPIWNEEAGWVDQFGVFEFDLEAGTEQLIVAFPWDNGLWYVEDIFGASNHVVVSLSDSPDPGGNPLPALVIDLDSSDVTTLPTASFVRPAYQP